MKSSQSLPPSEYEGLSISSINAVVPKQRPCDHNMEQVVLGSLLNERSALAEVIDILQIHFFDDERNRIIFKAIESLFASSQAVDIATVMAKLRSIGEDEKIGYAYVTELSFKVNSSANIAHHAAILREYAIRRRLIDLGNQCLEKAQDNTQDVLEVLDGVESSLFEVSDMNIKKEVQIVENLVEVVVNEIDRMRNKNEILTGVPSCFEELDQITAGWQNANLVILAARPGMGKTAFALSLIRNAALQCKRPVAFFSLEMASHELIYRLISSELEINNRQMQSGNISTEEWEKIAGNLGMLKESSIYIDDTAALPILELRAKCRRLKYQYHIEMVVIDYLQLLNTDKIRGGNREQEIAYISRSLKQIAKELNIPVIVLSQLNRAVETRGGEKRPQLVDLRESGSIEQDADMVLFLYRPAYYEINKDEQGNDISDLVELIIAKNRNGVSGKNISLTFKAEYMKFENRFPQVLESKMNNNQRDVFT